MAAMLFQNLTDSLHQHLKRRAGWHRRSLNKEVNALIEAGRSRPFRPCSGPRIYSPNSTSAGLPMFWRFAESIGIRSGQMGNSLRARQNRSRGSDS